MLAIAQRFLTDYAAEEGKRFQRFSTEAQAILLDYDWPGNVRQLQNVVRHIVVLNNAEVVSPAMLPLPINRLRAVPTLRLSPVSGDRQEGLPAGKPTRVNTE
jgi:two-component system repressor protein LuxO